MSGIIAIGAASFAAAAVFMLVYYGGQRLAASLGKFEQQKRASVIPSQRHPFVSTCAQRLARLLPQDFVKTIGRRITMAGGLNHLTPAELTLYGMGAALVATFMGVLLIIATGWPAYVVLGMTLTGALLPFIWLRDQVQGRHIELLRELPYHIDLLTLCVEAGLDFSAALQRMVEKGRQGPLVDEFKTLLTEMRVGKTRAQALIAMGERVGLAPLSSFLSALVQADRLGTSFGRILRLQADQLRQERFQRAETLANEAPVKMLLPLIVFVFPTIWIILSAPLIFQWVFGAPPF